MADYFTTTIIDPALPLADITPLERLALGTIFETDQTDAGLSCFAWESVNHVPSLPAPKVRDALLRANGMRSRLHDLVTAQLADTGANSETLIST